MDYLVNTIATVMGVVMSFGYYPQAWRIYKNKSAENVSIGTFTIFGIGTTTWFLYGLYLNNWVIMASFIFGVIGSWLVLFLTLWYRRGRNS